MSAEQACGCRMLRCTWVLVARSCLAGCTCCTVQGHPWVPLPWPGWVPVLGVLRGVWQPGWLCPRKAPSPCTPFFTVGAVAMPTSLGQPSAALGSSRGVDGCRSCCWTGAGRWLPPGACNNSRWPGTTLSAFIVNEEIIKSILQS